MPAIDQAFRYEKCGVQLSDAEIEYFRAHQYIWNQFLASHEDTCLIREASANLLLSTADIEEDLADLEDDWDVFFPFDKTQEDEAAQQIALQTSQLGYYWGDHIYILSRRGCEKLLDIAVIRQPVDEEILEALSNDALTVFYANTGYFACEEEQLYSVRIRQKAILNAALSHTAWSAPNKSMARRLLDLLNTHAERNNIHLVLHGGSLLGHIRHDEIMPWDDDIDLGIASQAVSTLLLSLETEGIARFKVYPWTYNGANSIYYKVWLDEGEEIPGYEYKFPFVDIWLYYENDDEVFYKDAERFRFPKHVYYPFKQIQFEGCTMKIPNHPVHALDLMYKDWKSHIVVYSWSHRLEKAAFRQLKAAINVDADGRLQL
ncbi:LicD family protein [Chitinophaga agrisoli]|uniref:LicD family protein n=1 Tax=Chitinophaga agrisoli TaxID=2607653 RepID=UPI0016620945|nr:LicD family protein [Chitinophaga agrisoli]